ncbi:MAG: hypothetical protein ACI9FB_001864 [Candidatus Azotimanducaceae bacterium]|jgi:hypothetical protein
MDMEGFIFPMRFRKSTRALPNFFIGYTFSLQSKLAETHDLANNTDIININHVFKKHFLQHYGRRIFISKRYHIRFVTLLPPMP